MNNHTRAENYAYARGTSLVYRYTDDGDLVVQEGLTPRQSRRFRHKHNRGESEQPSGLKKGTSRSMLRSGNPAVREQGIEALRQEALKGGHWR